MSPFASAVAAAGDEMVDNGYELWRKCRLQQLPLQAACLLSANTGLSIEKKVTKFHNQNSQKHVTYFLTVVTSPMSASFANYTV